MNWITNKYWYLLYVNIREREREYLFYLCIYCYHRGVNTISNWTSTGQKWVHLWTARDWLCWTQRKLLAPSHRHHLYIPATKIRSCKLNAGITQRRKRRETPVVFPSTPLKYIHHWQNSGVCTKLNSLFKGFSRFCNKSLAERLKSKEVCYSEIFISVLEII